MSRYNVLPVWVEMPADLLTPVSAYLRVARARGNHRAFLLESVEGGERVARYSFLGVDPYASLQIVRDGAGAGRLELSREGKKTEVIPGNPMAELGRYLARYRGKPVEGLPPFCGGAVGYLGYECSGYLEKTGEPSARITELDADLMLFRDVIAFDHVKHRVVLISNILLDEEAEGPGRERAVARLEVLKRLLSRQASNEKPLSLATPSAGEPRVRGFKGVGGRKRFCDSVRTIKNHIRAGDIFQCVLSEQFRFPLKSDPFAIYRALRGVSPSPYLFYLSLGGQTLLGASPEMLTRVTGSSSASRKVETSPIAGTRPRGKDTRDDARMERTLLASVKEKAEHLMLVDLGRNDLGRVSQPGTVNVHDFMHVERFSHVMHLVSTVEGRLKKEKTAWDALTSCFPAGTLSGAPKIRAQQIISKLELVQRGPYGGAIVCHDFAGGLNSCITIRSLLVRKGVGYLQAGAGIVADSNPEREYDEVENKTRAMRRAIEMATGGGK